MVEVTPDAFQLLLARFDADPLAAAEKYELLRLKLSKAVAWKGCPDVYVEGLADEVLDRVATKLAAGEDIENINAYAAQVLRFVWLEFRRKQREDTVDGEDGLPEIAVPPDHSILDDSDERINCLRICLNEVVPDMQDRALIVGYYDTDPGLKNKEHRKALAEKLGLTLNTLKVKACRIRARLEACITECLTAGGKAREI